MPYSSSPKQTVRQQGFTLLELMVAMTIFAVLAVAGWQVFDGLNRSKDRAQIQTTALSEIQFAYLQIQKDMAQIVPYQLKSEEGASQGSQGSSLQNNDTATQDTAINQMSNGFTLSSDSVSFIRFADPDPRYQSSPLLERIVYRIDNNRLLRQRFHSLNATETQTPLESVLLSDVTNIRFQALTPEPVAVFPDPVADSTLASQPTPSLPASDTTGAGEMKQEQPKASLPKGVVIEYGYQMGSQQVPISWHFALQATPPIPVAIEKPKPEPEPNN